MRVKIKKNVLGEVYCFYVTIEPKTFRCSCSIHFKIGKSFGATVTNDFSHIVLDDPIELNGYINGINPPKKTITKIKIPKDLKHDFRDMINGVH